MTRPTCPTRPTRPPFFHLRSIPGATWPALPASDASQAWAAFQTLDRTQWLDPSELDAATGSTADAAPALLSRDPLIETGPSFGMDIRQEPKLQLFWLHRVRPNYLLSMPTNLEILAGLVEERGTRLEDLLAIQSFGEPLPDQTRQRIERAFGVPVKNLYSATEAGYIASPCPAGHGLHVHSENVIAEVLDADGRPCLPGHTGRLVFTTLHNFLAPFVRYEILDEVTLASDPCPCGRGLPLWTQVEGRRHPAVHLPDGRRKSSVGVTIGVRNVGGALQYQIVQRAPDHAIIRVVPDATWTTDHAARVRGVRRGQGPTQIPPIPQIYKDQHRWRRFRRCSFSSALF